jgi:hypothetical protein
MFRKAKKASLRANEAISETATAPSGLRDASRIASAPKAPRNDSKARILSDLGFILLLGAAIFLFFPEMFFLKLSFVSGDHRAQHYPWAVFLAERLKEFQLPWWTSRFQCGFPLLAEGQVGAFYPINLFFYFLFSPFVAYTYGILTHYLLGAIFFYVYLRSLKLSGWSSLFGTLVYLFGTAQGGYYYNIISQKVLIWLPLTFYLADRIVEDRRRSLVLWLGLVFSFQMFGGYLQYAIYSIGFSILYFLWAASSKLKEAGWDGWGKNVGWLFTSLAVTAVLSLAQLLPTWELAQLSNRFSFQEEFAYVGSVNPLALATLFFPHWDGFLKAEIYVGILGLFFVFVAATTKMLKREWFFVALTLLTLGLALGKFNPLFVGLIKATRFYGFRTPSKFLFFLAVGLAVLSAFGFEKWTAEGSRTRRFSWATGIFGGLSLLGIVGILFPVAQYLAQWERIYGNILARTEILDPWNLTFLGFLVGSWLFLRSRFAFSKVALASLLFANLYCYGFTSVKGNYEAYAFIETPSEALKRLTEEKGIFRIHRAPATLASTDVLPPLLHVNMLYGLDVTGGYSPFVHRDYYELFRDVGDVNDSQRHLLAEKEALVRESALLDFLNAKFIVTDLPLDQTEYTPLREEEGYGLYQNDNFLPRAFFVGRATEVTWKEFLEEVRRGRFSPTRKVYLIEKQSGEGGTAEGEEIYKGIDRIFAGEEEIKVEFTAPSRGYLVTSDLYYPGWKAWVNDVERPILRANGIFRAVGIPSEGKFTVQFSYRPLWKKLVGVTFIGSILTFLAPLFFLGRKKS